MWLLVKYYSAYVILRQRFLTSGEASVNEWQEQYMSSSLDKRGKEEGKGVLAALRHFKQLFDPSEVWFFQQPGISANKWSDSGSRHVTTGMTVCKFSAPAPAPCT